MNASIRIFFAILILLYSYQGQGQSTKADAQWKNLDTAFARILHDWHAAGFSVAVVVKDKVVYARSFGYKDYDNKIPATPNTLYAIGSCSKAFTASLIGILEHDGKLDIDQPVRNYLPDLHFYNDEMNDKITLRDMMCHRTGLPRHDASWYFFTTNSRDSLMKRIQFMEPSAGIREKWQYNNFMFMLQGVVAEKLTNQSWEQNIKEKIFLPLGMTASNLNIEDLAKSPDAAIGYGIKNDSLLKKLPYYNIGVMSPAGSINSSVNDMSKWLITILHGGKYEGKEIVPASFVSQALSSQMVIGAALPEKDKEDIYMANYGFGWGMVSYRGHYMVSHGGNIDGFSASTTIFPSDSIGIVVLCNQDGSSVPGIVRNLIADKLIGAKYKDWETIQKTASNKARAENKESEKAKTSSRKLNTVPSHPLQDYQGIYTNKGYGSFEIALQKDSLFAQIGTHNFWLRHFHYDLFDLFEKDPETGIDTTNNLSKLQFATGETGDIESGATALEPLLKPIVFTRTDKMKALTPDDLKKYEGDYELSSAMNAKVYTKSANTLYLFVTGQPEYELVPVGINKFSIKGLNGFTILFNLNDKNEAIELVAIQPNGTFKAPRKK